MRTEHVSEVSFGRRIVRALRRRAEVRLHRVRMMRLAESDPRGAPSGPAQGSPPWPALAVPPGNPAGMMTRGTPVDAARLEPGERAWKVLSAAPLTVSTEDPARLTEMARLGSDLPAAALHSYRPIDWHRDARSGYVWDPGQFYLDVRVAPVPGADIKMPRELSRFQHVGALANGTHQDAGVEFLLQVVDWIAANPFRRGVNWACTMDVALRAVNWIWGLRLFEREIERYPDTLRLIAGSLHDHGRHIEDNLEYYAECTTNHYLSNVAGLIYIGAAFPDAPESDRWLLFGLQELVSEMERQVYEDGADYEASTNYHRLVAELFASSAAIAERIPSARRARLARVDRRAHRVQPPLRPPGETGLNLAEPGAILPREFYARLARMAEFTAVLTKSNGLVPQFGDNDSARVHKLRPRTNDDPRDHRHLLALVGTLVDRRDLRDAGASAADEARLVAGGLDGVISSPRPTVDLRSDLTCFPRAGVAVARRGEAFVAVTCGANGQGGRGGHGHNDKGGFELNVRGDDFIVDGGCPEYSSAAEIRNRYRSTAAHSTVAIVGEEQDRWLPGPAGLFRLPERSRPALQVDAAGAIMTSHGGFGPVHQRRFMLETGCLVVEDTLDDARTKQINFNLDPAVAVREVATDGETVTCDFVHANGSRVHVSVSPARHPVIAHGSFSIGYGVPVDNLRFSVHMPGPSARTVLSWAP